MSTLNLVVLVLSILVFLPSVDRLRHLHWKTTKSKYVALHLGMSLWSLLAAHDAITEGATRYQVVVLFALVCWCMVSARTWAGGNPPNYAMKKGEG